MNRIDKYDIADLVDLCLYQQDIIKQYEQYIEKFIHQPIQKTIDKHRSHLNFNEQIMIKQITLPEIKIAVKCSPRELRTWELIKYETPRVPVDYFIRLGHEYEKEMYG